MKLEAHGLLVGGAILLDASTGKPLPIEPAFFIGELDAAAFVEWLEEPPSDVRHLRELARGWPRLRKMPRCPTCQAGRVAAGKAQCEACLEETLRERESILNHDREPGRNAVGARHGA